MFQVWLKLQNNEWISLCNKKSTHEVLNAAFNIILKLLARKSMKNKKNLKKYRV